MSHGHSLMEFLGKGAEFLLGKIADPTRYYKEYRIDEARREVRRMMRPNIALVTPRVGYKQYLGAVLELIKEITADQTTPSPNIQALQEHYEQKLKKAGSDTNPDFFSYNSNHALGRSLGIALPKEIVYKKKIQEELENELRIMYEFLQDLEVPEDKFKEGQELSAWFAFLASRTIPQTSFAYLGLVVLNNYENENDLLAGVAWRDNIEKNLQYTQFNAESLNRAFNHASDIIQKKIKGASSASNDIAAFNPELFKIKASAMRKLKIEEINPELEDQMFEALNYTDNYLQQLGKALSSLPHEVSKVIQLGYQDTDPNKFEELIEEKKQEDQARAEYLLSEIRKFFFEKAQSPKDQFFKPPKSGHSRQDTHHQLHSHYKIIKDRLNTLVFLLKFSTQSNLLIMYNYDKMVRIDRMATRYMDDITKNQKAIFEEIKPYLSKSQINYYLNSAASVKPTAIFMMLVADHPSRANYQELIIDLSEQLKAVGDIFKTRPTKAPGGPAVF